MNITEIRIRLKDNADSQVRAIVSITIENCFVIHDIKIISGADGMFIAMPSRKGMDGKYKDIVHPINTETREMLKNCILDKYNEVIGAIDAAV